ncbi:Fc.00g044100.m01.CDS01 [Cosmosporella sp. VM-42]
MADPKSKTVNGNNTNGSHVPDKAQQKQSKLWQLLALAKEVTKDVEAVQDYEKSVEGRRALEQELEAKSGEAQRLRDLNDKVMREFTEHKAQANAKSDALLAQFEQRYKTYESGKAEVEAAEKKVAEMEEKIKASEASHGEVQKLKRRLQSAESHTQSHAAEMKEMNAECELQRTRVQTAEADLDVSKEKLGQAQRDLGEGILREYGVDGLRQLGLDLKALSKKCHTLVVEYFNDLDGAKASRDSAGEIQDLKARFPKIPLTTDTTRAAAQMRSAVAEAVIAEVLTTQIFVPFYLANGLKTAASTLLDIFGDDERRRSIYRCQILQSRTDAEEVARVEEDIVRKASNEVRTTLHPLVVAFKQAGFYNAVPTFFREALRLWAEVQRSRDLITAEAPDMNEVQPPSKYEEYDQASGSSPSAKGSKSGAKPSIAAVLFPQVATREDLIFNGMALWSNQGALVAATQEGATNGVNGHGESMKQAASRRRSIVGPESPFRSR